MAEGDIVGRAKRWVEDRHFNVLAGMFEDEWHHGTSEAEASALVLGLTDEIERLVKLKGASLYARTILCRFCDGPLYSDERVSALDAIQRIDEALRELDADDAAGGEG